jgi:hypothetical protein
MPDEKGVRVCNLSLAGCTLFPLPTANRMSSATTGVCVGTQSRQPRQCHISLDFPSRPRADEGRRKCSPQSLLGINAVNELQSRF